jgi:hypothetical protein
MPRVKQSYNGETTFYEINELPSNVNKFVKELTSLGINNIEDITYEEFTPKEDSEDDDLIPANDLSVYISVDSEEAAKNMPYGFERTMQRKADDIARYFSIDDVYIFVKYYNKEEFATKFLKKLKANLKTTEIGHAIHSIRYNAKDRRVPEIGIVKKRNIWPNVWESDMRKIIQDSLDIIGYPNVRITFVN